MIAQIKVIGNLKVEINEIDKEKVKHEIENALPILLNKHLKILSGRLHILLNTGDFEITHSVDLKREQHHEIYIQTPTNFKANKDVCDERW